VQLTGSGVGIPTDSGTTIVAGKVDTLSTTPGQTGGTVNVLGDRVGVIGGNIDASGTNGGGTVLIGGDYQGQGTVPNASRTFVSSDSVISADSLVNGNGGHVIVWADDTSRFYGTITARGGTQGGNGGFVETSGKNSLDVVGASVDASATFGQAGTWLLDPRNVLIQAAATNGGAFAGGNLNIFTPTADNAVVNTTTIETALNAGTSVTITTGITGTQQGDIFLISPINTNATGNATLTLNAANAIFVNETIIMGLTRDR
jgi:hypothetical protein